VKTPDKHRQSYEAIEAPILPVEVVASQVMRRDVPAIVSDESLARAADLMAMAGCRELPVVGDGGRLVGIVARTDLEPYRGHLEWTSVRAAMTLEPATVGEDTPVHSVARLLLERQVNAVPVVVDGILVGMIARSDLLRLLAEEGEL
jgi:CBS domain-containing protein